VTLTGTHCSWGWGQECYWGIPYAAAPIADERFRPPSDYTYTVTEYDASEKGMRCSEPGETEEDGYGEDCLFLNVYAPKDAQDSDDLPVMVWIHGGCFVYGSSSEYEA